jgi:hypothetical protein
LGYSFRSEAPVCDIGIEGFEGELFVELCREGFGLGSGIVTGGSALSADLTDVGRRFAQSHPHGSAIDRLFESGLQRELVLGSTVDSVDVSGDVSPVDDNELG